jgi:hypothetical protein
MILFQLVQYNNVYIYFNGSSYVLRTSDRSLFESLNEPSMQKFDFLALNHFNSLYTKTKR